MAAVWFQFALLGVWLFSVYAGYCDCIRQMAPAYFLFVFRAGWTFWSDCGLDLLAILVFPYYLPFVSFDPVLSCLLYVVFSRLLRRISLQLFVFFLFVWLFCISRSLDMMLDGIPCSLGRRLSFPINGYL